MHEGSYAELLSLASKSEWSKPIEKPLRFYYFDPDGDRISVDCQEDF